MPLGRGAGPGADGAPPLCTPTEEADPDTDEPSRVPFPGEKTLMREPRRDRGLNTSGDAGAGAVGDRHGGVVVGDWR